MKRYLLSATVADRAETLGPWITSVKKYLSDWIPVIVIQGYSVEMVESFRARWPEAMIFSLFERCGPHNAKMVGLRWIDSQNTSEYVVCSVDDDMEFLDKTDLTPCVRKCIQPEVGLVSAGWVKDFTKLMTYKMVKEFVKQPIVYTGGGLLFSRKVAKLVLKLPECKYCCDNSEWSLTSYTNGYLNYRYRGSVTVHKVGGKGGLRGWRTATDTVPPSGELLKMNQMKTAGDRVVYRIGLSEDLTPLAHALHKRNKKYE